MCIRDSFKRDRYPASFSENTEHFRHALVHLAFLAAFIARAAFAVAIAVFITDGTGVTIPAADDFIIIFKDESAVLRTYSDGVSCKNTDLKH